MQTNDMSDALRVLRFWRDVEIFNIPAAPTSRDATKNATISTVRRGESLPWGLDSFAPTEDSDSDFVHVVYLGVADTADLARLVHQGFSPECEMSEQDQEPLTGTGWMAAFVVDEQGHPVSDSYLPASFVHGVAALRDTGTLDKLNTRLARAKEEFAQRHTQAKASKAVMGWAELDAEMRILSNLLGSMPTDAKIDWRVVVSSIKTERKDRDKPRRSVMAFMNSFYLDDLDRLIRQAEKKEPFGKALSTYLGPELPNTERVDILEDNDSMSMLVSAKWLPSARWPSSPKHPLVLAQQAAVARVNRALRQADGIIGVNGPPGTGKTTLLCDVIAEIITARARKIADLGSQGELFDAAITVAKNSFYPIKRYVIDGTSIVVASTNNNAVANITQELPARKKIADEFSESNYFADVMRGVFCAQGVVGNDKEPLAAWGVIAAALGKGENCGKFLNGFFREDQDESEVASDTPPSMKQVLVAAKAKRLQYQEEWRKAKEDFIALQAEFERCRDTLAKAEDAAKAIDSLQSDYSALLAAAQIIPHTIAQLAQDRETQQAEHSKQSNVVNGYSAMEDQVRSAYPLTVWDHVLEFFGFATRRTTELLQALATPKRLKADAVASTESQLNSHSAKQQEITADMRALEDDLAAHKRVKYKGVSMGAKHFPDAKFWQLPVDERHCASIAANPHLDDLRAKLFLKAVDLHRLTILANAEQFLANLQAVTDMLNGGKLALAHRPLVWDAFFFVVPVVSTTLASFDRLFRGMNQNSLGWLLLDEAGQATPQSAAGALWRSRRAVIVGDPLQIAPVVTVPSHIIKALRDHHGVDARWSPAFESVQTLADRITHFGAWVPTGGSLVGSSTGKWTGMPLRAHRRCDDTMFMVSNSIAYAGQMVQGRKRKGEPTSVLGPSAWFHVQSTRVAHPVSEDELDVLIERLRELRAEGKCSTQIYVISPFRKVAAACEDRIKKAGLTGVDCGTVHTFQGKEAPIVFLVLGTDSSVSGAREWAAGTPNLLNVAVTRAQDLLYVIGDANNWGSLPYFSTLRNALPLCPQVAQPVVQPQKVLSV